MYIRAKSKYKYKSTRKHTRAHMLIAQTMKVFPNKIPFMDRSSARLHSAVDNMYNSVEIEDISIVVAHTYTQFICVHQLFYLKIDGMMPMPMPMPILFTIELNPIIACSIYLLWLIWREKAKRNVISVEFNHDIEWIAAYFCNQQCS